MYSLSKIDFRVLILDKVLVLGLAYVGIIAFQSATLATAFAAKSMKDAMYINDVLDGFLRFLKCILLSLVQVHLDHMHMGIGGDDSWTPCVHPQYLVPPQPYQFSIRFCPLTPQSSPFEICQTQLENVS